MTDLRGARALVTGASSGIGRATAVALGAAGCELVLTGRDEVALAQVAERTRATVLLADLADRAAISELARRLATQVPDIVVHNAGTGLSAPTGQTRASDVDQMLSVNLRAPILLTGALLPAMLQRGSGHLVFVSSIAGFLGVANEAAYAASKAGLTAYADSLRVELVPTCLHVTTVVPGVVQTEFFARRGVPYARRRPAPISPDRVASALVRAVRLDRPEVVVPAWLRVPIALRACAPATYARLGRRWG